MDNSLENIYKYLIEEAEKWFKYVDISGITSNEMYKILSNEHMDTGLEVIDPDFYDNIRKVLESEGLKTEFIDQGYYLNLLDELRRMYVRFFIPRIRKEYSINPFVV